MPLHEVCQSIHRYIASQLHSERDFGIFSCNTLVELGKYFTDKVCINVDGSSLNELQIVIKATHKLKDKAFTDEEFYEYFAKYLGFYKIPRHIYFQLLRKYVRIHKEFTYLNQEIGAQAAAIGHEMNSLNNGREELVCRSNSHKSVTKDLKSLEYQLLDYITQIADYSTEKEMLEYSQKVLVESFEEINCQGDKQAIKNNLKSQAFHYIREDSPEINSYFDYFQTILDITKENAQDYLRVGHKVKLYRFNLAIQKYFNSAINTKATGEAIEICRSMADEIPSVNELSSAKVTNPIEYKRLLTILVETNSVIEQIVKDIEGNYCLQDRKNLLLISLKMFEDKKFDAFNNLIAIQIEGLFADYLYDVTTFNRFTDLNLYTTAVLREKISFLINSGSGIYTEAILYFNYYFNNRIRNLVAHGNYFLKFKDKLRKEVFALELLLDLNFVLYMITRESESQKMLRFVRNYKKPFQIFKSDERNHHFGALLNDLNSHRTHHEFDRIEYTKPMQVFYWLVNQNYAQIFSTVATDAEVDELNDLRKDLLSKEFWAYVLEKLDNAITENYKFYEVHSSFKSIVNSLFSCIQDPDTLTVLRRVSAKLRQTNYYA